jgi:hypothetical protein
MPEVQSVETGEAVGLARQCFENIASAIQDAIAKAEQLEARDMLDKLITAKAAADRGSELIVQLEAMLQADQPLENRISSE